MSDSADINAARCAAILAGWPVCIYCNGSGLELWGAPCADCGGVGYVTNKKADELYEQDVYRRR